ncbi:MAG: hypothetical protein COV74_03920 [Candidatus Omnitrophica bacterium CG11_big_fil_rev_8_21_14_0_20_45_26]|uniref:Tetratricopeptide repeat protein n=1 Tax=Candidatus Abzuiibacterium crystallinum TaxID=1974748 RepID=A0A2H0LQM7_9BACT|nr:MAG: hypothetical protein COV74_03920 [Candidatus Omnitrophica bacterium CG11_big_fil_rev_8_21_14_0_20_45_26]PIW65437.1 MAG: hypothetical protein COW12_01890 [Candidatus Omnitrophica bacterium CG12_big_fil_rev_8_21_14_0_65_45_16]
MEWQAENEMAMEYLQKGYELQTKGKINEAIVNYKKSIEFYPTAEAHTFLGWAYSFLGNHDAAILECKKAITIDPDYGNPYNDIGAYLIDKNKLDEALTWLEKATQAKRYENYCYPHYNIGRVHEKKGQWFLALEAYEKALQSNRDYTLASRAINRMKALLN